MNHKDKDKPDTSSSNWDESVRTAVDLASRPASPATPPMPDGVFTAGELGLPDSDEETNHDGQGPLQQEGEGNRQNDQLAELEQDLDAKADLERRR